MSRVLSCEELISKMPDLYQSCLFSVFFFFDMFLQSQTQVSSVSAGVCLGMMTSFAAS